MNTNKHTPGPWEVDYSGPARLEIKGGEQSIALCNMQCDDGDVDEANARLISAAPELLAACTDAERVINGPIAELLTGDSMSDTGAYEALRLLQEAIRKARGEV
jgi:hypothetical protein